MAQIVGLHPNTVRRYEEWQLLPQIPRLANGYRSFNDFHIELIQTARLAFQIEVLQAGLRLKMIAVVKALAQKDYAAAQLLLTDYLRLADQEIHGAHEAIRSAEDLLKGLPVQQNVTLPRSQTAATLGVTIDALRNWELNGLLTVKRSRKQYRIYTAADLQRLKIIRTLRAAKFSLEAILRLLNALDKQAIISVQTVLDSPPPDIELISVCDQLLTSLETAKDNAQTIQQRIQILQQKYPA